MIYIYICDECFNVYRSHCFTKKQIDLMRYDKEHIACHLETCEGGIWEVDDYLLPSIELLYKKGYFVWDCFNLENDKKYCNENTLKELEKIHFYIEFFEKYEFENLPNGFKLYNYSFCEEEYTKDCKTLIRLHNSTDDIYGRDYFEKINELYEWVKRLPKNIKNKMN